MDYLAPLNEREKEELLTLPAYVSLLAARHNGNMDKQERQAAIKLSHIRTYSCEPMLASFYWEADKVFVETISELDRSLPAEWDEREQAIRQEIRRLDALIAKLEPAYGTSLRHSLQSFTHHVARAHNNVFEYLLFPMTGKGIHE